MTPQLNGTTIKKKNIDDTTVKDIKSLFRPKKELKIEWLVILGTFWAWRRLL